LSRRRVSLSRTISEKGCVLPISQKENANWSSVD